MAHRKNDLGNESLETRVVEQQLRLEKERQFVEKSGWSGLLSGELSIGFRLLPSPVLSSNSESYKWLTVTSQSEDKSAFIKAAGFFPME